MTVTPIHRIVDEPPTWPARSALVLFPGLWRMRNGHTAEIKARLDIPYRCGATGKAKIYSIWKGRCVECDAPMTWTFNGCYAAVGKHRNDVIGPIKVDVVPLARSIGEIIEQHLDEIVGPETAALYRERRVD